MRTTLITALLFPFLSLLPAAPAQAQQPTTPVVRPDEAGLPEQMTKVQLRHIKLWFAGKLGNWKLATYQLDFLATDLSSAGKGTPVGLSAEDTARSIESVRSAIDAKDRVGFTKAYSELTTTCNACHRAAGRGFIAVQVPTVSPFTDQDFADQEAEGKALAHTICGTCHAVPDKPNVPPSLSFSAPSLVELAHRPSLTESTLRQLLISEHRRLGPDQTMPNPRLNNTQIDAIVAYFEALKLNQH